MDNQNEENIVIDANNETYVLAILAALLNPKLCKSNPVDALKEADDLLIEADIYRHRRDTGYYDPEKPIDYSEAVLRITGEDKKKNPHPGRAKDSFTKFWADLRNITEADAVNELRDYKDGKQVEGKPTLPTLSLWSELYADWKSRPKKRKGKQGRVKNPEKDKRKEARPMPLSGLKSII